MPSPFAAPLGGQSQAPTPRPPAGGLGGGGAVARTPMPRLPSPVGTPTPGAAPPAMSGMAGLFARRQPSFAGSMSPGPYRPPPPVLPLGMPGGQRQEDFATLAQALAG